MSTVTDLPPDYAPPTESPPESPPPVTTQPEHNDSIVEDIVLWRKKKLSTSVLAAATATWVLLQIYQFNFITVASWAAMAVVAALFLSGNLLRLFGKPPPSTIFTGVPEQSAIEMANELRRLEEEAVRWMLRVGAENEWYEFGGVIAALYVLSLVGSCFDLLTLLYIGVVMGLSVPVIYVKNKEKIRRYWESMKVKGRRFYDMVDEKILRKIKHKLGVPLEKKEKKVE